MRPDVSTYGLLTCLLGLATAQPGIGDTGTQPYLLPLTTTTDTSSTTSVESSLMTSVESSSTNSVESSPTTSIGSSPTTSGEPNAILNIDVAPATFSLSQGYQNFTWEIAAGISITVSRVNLKRYDGDTLIAQGGVSPGTQSTTTESDTTTNSDEAKLKTRQDILPTPVLKTTSDSVTLDLSSDVMQRNLNIPLYFQFEWANDTANGSSYSGAFALYQDSWEDAESAVQATGLGSSPVKNETIESASTTATTTTTTSSATATTGASKKGTGSSGLSTGAIVGIAVGCGVVGILIVVFVIWFFLVRRPARGTQQHHSKGSYATGSGNHRSIIHDKMFSAAGSEPYSAYGDEARALHHQRSSLSMANINNINNNSLDGDNNINQQGEGYAPYTDAGPHPSQPPPTSHQHQHQLSGTSGITTAAAAAATTLPTSRSQTDVTSSSLTHNNTSNSMNDSNTTPRPATATGTGRSPSRYAHLIEEGMTEDEIRRLEEEERHLDAAIEVAGRGSGSRMSHAPRD
ncbi:hypothetical protein F4778DRAFT_553135 [Xylariomycetidae sp. FL2044]|nr:hypothetical protein F4778DRAFT_553135 [Xylariomycetidae sp. FL2044]